jgi:hypothetical protein
MRYTTRKVESARTKVSEMEHRIAGQRRIMDDDLVIKGNVVADGRTQLAIMEHSLVKMRGFLQKLENLQISDRAKPKRRAANLNRSSEVIPEIEASSEIDVLDAAEAVIQQHGDRAPLFCARKMVDMLERGDLNRVATWLAIRHATRSLLDE